MLAESLILSIIIGKLRGLNVSSLEKVSINKLWLIIFSVLIEITSSIVLKNNIKPISELIINNYFFIHLLIYMSLFLFFISNTSYKSFYIVGLGSLLNFMVIMANKGFMPVSISMGKSMGFQKTISTLEAGRIAGHTIMVPGKTPLWFLGDIINIPPPYPFPQTISIGDVFLILGAFMFIQNQMKFHSEKF